jgi:hypothetical protein
LDGRLRAARQSSTACCADLRYRRFVARTIRSSRKPTGIKSVLALVLHPRWRKHNQLAGKVNFGPLQMADLIAPLAGEQSRRTMSEKRSSPRLRQRVRSSSCVSTRSRLTFSLACAVPVTGIASTLSMRCKSYPALVMRRSMRWRRSRSLIKSRRDGAGSGGIVAGCLTSEKRREGAALKSRALLPP